MPRSLNTQTTLNFPEPFKAMPRNFQQIQWVIRKLEFDKEINGGRIPKRFREYRRDVLEKLRTINVISLIQDCIKDLSTPKELDIFLGLTPRSDDFNHLCVDQAIRLGGLQDKIGIAFPDGEKFTWELPYALENGCGCKPFRRGYPTPYVSWRDHADRNAKHLVAFFTRFDAIRQASPGLGHMMLVTKGPDGTISFIDRQGKHREARKTDYVLAWKIPGSNGSHPLNSVQHE